VLVLFEESKKQKASKGTMKVPQPSQPKHADQKCTTA